MAGHTARSVVVAIGRDEPIVDVRIWIGPELHAVTTRVWHGIRFIPDF